MGMHAVEEIQDVTEKPEGIAKLTEAVKK
jgi:hypothetical protein